MANAIIYFDFMILQNLLLETLFECQVNIDPVLAGWRRLCRIAYAETISGSKTEFRIRVIIQLINDHEQVTSIQTYRCA
jgi:hypothetical protein